MSIFKNILTNFTEKAVESKIEAAAVEFYDNRRIDPEIIQKVETLLKEKYKNELFYEDLYKYISRNNTITSSIKNARRNFGTGVLSKEEFVENNSNNFLRNNAKYKKKPLVIAQVTSAFSEIYEQVFRAINAISSHSDVGKLQNEILRIESSQKLIAESQMSISRNTDNTVQAIFAMLESQIGISETAISELKDHSAEIDKYMHAIKKIETEYQQNYLFNDALAQYFELLQTISNTFRGARQNQTDALFCTLNCNIALCYANLGEMEKAYNSLSNISPSVAETSKIYNYVFATIIVQSADSEKYASAQSSADKALELDPQYHKAILLRHYVIALMNSIDKKTNLVDLDSHFISIVQANEDEELIANYYARRGMINRLYDDPISAIEDFTKANEYGYDEIISDFNIASALYSQAVSGLTQNQRIMFPDIDHERMIKSLEILKSIVFSDKIDKSHYYQIKEYSISLYVSACSLIGVKHGLTPIREFLKLSQEYEQKRLLVLGSDEELTDEELEFLDQEDKLFLEVRKLLDDSEFSECKIKIINAIDSEYSNLSAPIIHIFLQICIIEKEPTEYWKYRYLAVENEIIGSPLNAMDAFSYELEGNVQKAKLILDEIAINSTDYHLLENISHFYARNDYKEEQSTLYVRIHNLCLHKLIYMDDFEHFYRDAIGFFVKQQSPLAEKLISELPLEIVSPEFNYYAHSMFYNSIKDIGQLCNTMSIICLTSDSFHDHFNLALCQRWLLRYDDALNTCFSLLKTTSEEENIVKIYWLISDILLFQEKSEESSNWAIKAHELVSQNPYEESHQALLARALRCGSSEGIAAIMKYKEEHPVVIDWMEPFRISDENPLEELFSQLEERFPDSKNYANQEKGVAQLYRKGNVSFNLIYEYYDGDWSRILNFGQENKLNIAIGNVALFNIEQTYISDDLVVDTHTLVMMSYYGCLPTLEKIKRVHINYGSIIALQQCYLSQSYQFVAGIMNWLYSAKNIVFEADGYTKCSDLIIRKCFSENFFAGCNIAIKYDIPFLFCDSFVNKLPVSPISTQLSKVKFVSIPSFCTFIEKDNTKQLEQMRYNLLKGCSFISFTANTILHQIQQNDYQASKEYLQPFLICKSDYDMGSFSVVYLGAIAQLSVTHPETAVSLAELILSDTSRIWKRGSHYRHSKQPSVNFRQRANSIYEYVVSILSGISIIFSDLPKELTPLFEELQVALAEDH